MVWPTLGPRTAEKQNRTYRERKCADTIATVPVPRGRPVAIPCLGGGWGTDPFQIVAKKVAHSRLPSLPGLIPVLGSQPAGDVIHKPGGRLPLLSARPAVTPATLKRAATNFAAW